MTQFAYTAVPIGGASPASQAVTGRADAPDARALREQLRAQGLVLIEAKPLHILDALRGAMARKGVRRADGAWFFATLAQLLAGKVPVESAVGTMETLAPSARTRAVCAGVREKLRAGESFADAVASVESLAQEAHLALLRAGQSAGRLEHSVALVDRSIEGGAELRRSVMGKLAYPIVLMLASLVSLWVLSTYVIPKFEESLATVGAELPLPTRITLASSGVLVWAVPVLVIAGVALVALKDELLNEKAKRKLDAFTLRLPVVGPLVANREAAVACDLTCTMLEGGGDLVTGLEQASMALRNREVRARLDGARSMVREGADLGDSIEQTGALPPMAVAVVKLGAKTGDLPGALRRAATLAQSRTEQTVQKLLMMMEPGVILFLGGTVGWVVYSLVAGMLAVNDAGSL